MNEALAVRVQSSSFETLRVYGGVGDGFGFVGWMGRLSLSLSLAFFFASFSFTCRNARCVVAAWGW